MSKILVTGSNGFIASYLIPKLVNDNYQVLGVSNSPYNGNSHNNYEHLQVDITDPIALKKVFDENDISIVIHLAAIAHLKGRNHLNWSDFYRVNTLASKHLFEMAVNNRAKIFFASTVDVYGNTNINVIDEEVIPQPNSDYGKSKYIAEQELMSIATDKVSFTIGRFAPVYGPDNLKDVFKRMYLKHPNIAYKIDSGLSYHFVSIYNIVEFILKWIPNTDSANLYNIADDYLVSSKAMLNYEKKSNKNLKVFLIPKLFINIANKILKTGALVVNNYKVKKINNNIYKLVTPPLYNNKKMHDLYVPKWDFINTLYKHNESTLGDEN